MFCPDNSNIGYLDIEAIEPPEELNFEDRNLYFCKNESGQWILKQTTPRNVCSVIEATAQIDRYLKMLKSKMKNTDFVLCFIYTGYFYYLRKLINIAWTRQFVGWCDLFTVMSEKLHKRNLGKHSNKMLKQCFLTLGKLPFWGNL